MRMLLIVAMLFLSSICGAASYNSVSVTSTQTTILPASRNRAGWIIHNVSTSTVYIGHDTSVSTATGVPILPGEKVMNDGPFLWNGQIKGIGPSGTSSQVRYFEWSHAEVSQ